MQYTDAYLSAEIQRLQALVRLLTDRNLELERLLAERTTGGPDTPMPGLPGDTESFFPPTQNPGGMTEDDFMPTQNLGGKTEDVFPPTQNPDGTKMPVFSPTQNSGRNNQEAIMPSPILDGRKPDPIMPTQNSGRTNPPVFIPSRVPGGTDQPDFIPTRYHGALVQPLRVPQVAPALPRALPGDAALVRVLKRSGMPDTHNTGLRRAASVLLLVAGGGTHSYKRIGALTGLSESGTSKLVSSLRRRGWLRRSEHHRLVLTDAGWALLQQALIT